MSIELCGGPLNTIVRRLLRRVALAIGSSSAALLVACGSAAPLAAQPLACADGIKTAFKPDASTSVVAVRFVKNGEALIAQDSAAPITAAADANTGALGASGYEAQWLQLARALREVLKRA